uniref:Uncharacterized protein n=1 Tax=Eutreptiella gymnastica TaxID=73025 RepID=A0A7S1HXU0_9EUGL|mmetsp:Transcript_112465/g.195321  ORF Transcript_112465/g.195321 Transcript_112465/m.195321 type:complete len:113 (+) Transcript_112465:328-666(+)
MTHTGSCAQVPKPMHTLLGPLELGEVVSVSGLHEVVSTVQSMHGPFLTIPVTALKARLCTSRFCRWAPAGGLSSSGQHPLAGRAGIYLPVILVLVGVESLESGHPRVESPIA